MNENKSFWQDTGVREWAWRIALSVVSVFTFLGLFWLRSTFVQREDYIKDQESIAAMKGSYVMRDDYNRDRELLRQAGEAQFRAMDTEIKLNREVSVAIKESLIRMESKFKIDDDQTSELKDHEMRIRDLERYVPGVLKR